MSEWLRTTVPGIITLGAIGSVIAYVALRLVSWVWHKYVSYALFRFGLANLRPFLIQQVLMREFLAKEDHPLSVGYVMAKGLRVTWSFMWVLVLGSGAFLYFSTTGLVFGWLPVTLLALLFLAVYRALVTVALYLAAYSSLMGGREDGVAQRLKDRAELSKEVLELEKALNNGRTDDAA